MAQTKWAKGPTLHHATAFCSNSAKKENTDIDTNLP